MLHTIPSPDVEEPEVEQMVVSGPRAGVDLGTKVDYLAAAVSAVLPLLVVADVHVWVRPPLALIFVAFVPGWTLLRLFGAGATVLTGVCSVAASLAVTILVGQATVLAGGWQWYPIGVGLAFFCAAAATLRILRVDDPAPLAAAETTVARPRFSRGALWCTTTAVGGAAVVVAGIAASDASRIDLLGIVDVLSPIYWVGVAIILAGLVFGLRFSSRATWISVGALLFALHGLPGVLEKHPRFSVAWVHVGFADHIAEQGTLLTSLDARFSWAGFFSGAAVLQRLAGTDSLLWVVRFAPLFYTAVSAVLVAVLARRFRATATQAVLAATIFGCLNWIGQDYFSPQATAFLLYLTLITVVLHVFPADPARWMSPRLRRILRPESDDFQSIISPDRWQRDSVAVLVGCYLTLFALVVSHQLTPGFFVSASILLTIGGATRLRTLPVAAVIMFLAWLSFGADAYWIGHFDELTGSVGQVSNLVSQNVSSRAATDTFERSIVVRSRIGLALLAWGVAAAAIIIGWFRRRTPIALLCLLVAPFPMLLLQPYGGEMALRVCYFTLAPASILAARLAPSRVLPGRQGTIRWVAIGLVIAVIVPVFVTARFGNEKFEMFSDDDVAIVDDLYRIAPADSVVFVASLQTLVYVERVADVRFRNLPGGSAAEVTDSLSGFGSRSAVFILLSESQAAYGTVSLQRPENWTAVLAGELLGTGRYAVRSQRGGSVLLELVQR